MAVLVKDEVGVEVAWPDEREPVPRVAVVSVLHVLLGLTNHLLVAPPDGAEVVATMSIGACLVSALVTESESEEMMEIWRCSVDVVRLGGRVNRASWNSTPSFGSGSDWI